MTKNEIYQARLDALLERAQKAVAFVKEANAEAKNELAKHLVSLEQGKMQENKPKELV